MGSGGTAGTLNLASMNCQGAEAICKPDSATLDSSSSLPPRPLQRRRHVLGFACVFLARADNGTFQ